MNDWTKVISEEEAERLVIIDTAFSLGLTSNTTCPEDCAEMRMLFDAIEEEKRILARRAFGLGLILSERKGEGG